MTIYKMRNFVQEFFTKAWAIVLVTGEGLYSVRDSNFCTYQTAAFVADGLNDMILNRPCHFAVAHDVGNTKKQARMYQPL
jgi:hypothetical protein